MSKKGFMLVEVVVSFFLITLVGTLIVLLYMQTIKHYDFKRDQKQAYIIVANIHEEFLASPESFTSDEFMLYYDKFLRKCERTDRFTFRVAVYYDVVDGVASLSIASVEKKEETLLKNINLGKMRLLP